MKTIFSELYNRIMDFFQIEKSEQTGQCASNRLQVILMHDRTKLDPVIMGKMRSELVEVFSKYVIIDKDELEIGLKNEGDSVALMLNIPIIRAKTDEELKEVLKDIEEDEETVGIIEEDDEDDEIVEELPKEDESEVCEKTESEEEQIVESVSSEEANETANEELQQKEDVSQNSSQTEETK